MFDIGWTEMAIVVVIALLVVGPKDLPKALRTIKAWIAKARGLAREFQAGVDEIVSESELADIKREVQDVAKDAAAGGFDELGDLDDLNDPIGNIFDESGLDGSGADVEVLAPTPTPTPKPKPAVKKKKKPAAKTAAKAATKAKVKTKAAGKP